jgi:translation initiation factor 2 beta subunit (eIF-2beta)/eIF-5
MKEMYGKENVAVCYDCLDRCVGCFSLVYKEDLVLFEGHSGDYYCVNCLKDYKKECEICGKVFYTKTKSKICNKHEGIYSCIECGKISKKTKTNGNIVKTGLCRFHYNKRFKKCERCGEPIDTLIGRYIRNLDGIFCRQCADILNTAEDVEIRVEPEIANSMNKYLEYHREVLLSNIIEFYLLELFDVYSKRRDGMNPVTTLVSLIDKKKACHPQDICYVSPFWTKMEDRFFDRKIYIENVLEKFFITYIFITCAGEARHIHRNDYGCRFKSSVPDWIRGGVPQSRNFIWAYAYEIVTQKSTEELLKYCDDLYILFTKFKWEGGYGGIKWGKIIKHLIDYLNGKKNKKVFIDQAVSLVHNGSIFLDKINIDIIKVRRILDLKFQAVLDTVPTLLKLLENYTDPYFIVYYFSALEWLRANVYPHNTELKIKKERPLKVGDILTLDPCNDLEYGITNSHTLVRVMEIRNTNNGVIDVMVIDSKDEACKSYIGQTFDVLSDYFNLIEKVENLPTFEDKDSLYGRLTESVMHHLWDIYENGKLEVGDEIVAYFDFVNTIEAIYENQITLTGAEDVADLVAPWEIVRKKYHDKYIKDGDYS